MPLTCPSCGNNHNYLVKTLQMHVVRLEDARVEVNDEGKPAVIEILCDECETALNFDDFDDAVRKEMLLTLGARQVSTSRRSRRLPSSRIRDRPTR